MPFLFRISGRTWKTTYKKLMTLEDKHSFLPDTRLINFLMFFFSVAVCKVTMRYGPEVTSSRVSLFYLYMMVFLTNTNWAVKLWHRFQKTAVVTKSMKEQRQGILIGRRDHFCPVFEFKRPFLCHYRLITYRQFQQDFKLGRKEIS